MLPFGLLLKLSNCESSNDMTPKSNKDVKSQSDKFIEAALEHEADDSEEAFDATLKKIATSVRHASDCAVNSAPAYEPGPCDCGAIKGRQ
jgi:hypothetical protein